MKAHWYKVPRKRMSRRGSETNNQTESISRQLNPLLKFPGRGKAIGLEKVKVK